jgi:hypothetical protein
VLQLRGFPIYGISMRQRYLRLIFTIAIVVATAGWIWLLLKIVEWLFPK